MEAQREGFRAHVFKAVALLLGAAALYLFVLALSSSLHTIRVQSLPLLALVLAAGAVGWLGWREERTERARAAGREAAARERVDTELRREDGTGDLHARIDELERELAATADTHARLAREKAEVEERHRRDLHEAHEKTARLKTARDA